MKGRRCIRATWSFASDSFRLFGCRNTGEPTLFAREKTTSWDTRTEMLGWTIDTVSMTISINAREGGTTASFVGRMADRPAGSNRSESAVAVGSAVALV